MLGLYLILVTASIVVLSSVIPAIQYVAAKIKRKEEKVVYVFSQELFDWEYTEITTFNCLKRCYKSYEEMRKEEFSKLLP